MPSLLDLTQDPPGLRGGVCSNCGFVFFPFQTFGCEACGHFGADLQPRLLAGRGTVTATTVVHRHADPRRPAPFRVVELTLDDGPSVRGVAVDDVEISVGDRVHTTMLPDVAAEDELLALRFAPEGTTN